MSGSRHEPQEPSSLTRIYGFVSFLTALVLVSFYVFLAITPSRVTVHILGEDIEGIQRIAGTIPVVLLLSIVFVMVGYAFVDLMMTPSLDDYSLITDKHARPWLENVAGTPVVADMSKLQWSRNIVAEARRQKSKN